MTLVLTQGVITILTAAGLIFGLIKQTKMFRVERARAITENENLELEQEERKLGLAKEFKLLATESAAEAVDAQKRLSALERTIIELSDKVKAQDKLIKSQAEHIKNQSTTIDQQNLRIANMVERTNKQDEEISKLTCEVNKYKALFGKMKQEGVISEEVAKEIDEC